MIRYSARLNKLETSIPLPTPVEHEETPGLAFRLADFLKEREEEKARFAALTPAGKIQAILNKIAERTAEAALPPPAPRSDRKVDLAPQLHALLVHGVKQGFHSEYYEIREYEIEILAAEGYDVRALKAAHDYWRELDWQWLPNENQLPREAQSIIDQALVVSEENQESADQVAALIVRNRDLV